MKDWVKQLRDMDGDWLQENYQACCDAKNNLHVA
jgi:hypothetical protein